MRDRTVLCTLNPQQFIGTMKKLFLVIALLIGAAQINAQQTTTTAATAQDPVKTEMRAMSGMMKDNLSKVTQKLQSVDKQLSIATAENSEALQKAKTELTAAKSELETSLTLVNTATPEQWSDVKAKAQALNDRVTTLLAGLK